MKLLQSNDTNIQFVLYPDHEKKDFYNNFAHSQSLQAVFNLMQRVIGPPQQQSSMVHLRELAVQRAVMP